MHVRRTVRGYERRVATFHEADGAGGHRLLYTWDEGSDTFRQVGEPRDPRGLRRYVEFVGRLVEAGEGDARAVRRKVVEFHAAEG
jgi:hypothetical protein